MKDLKNICIRSYLFELLKNTGTFRVKKKKKNNKTVPTPTPSPLITPINH